MSQVVTPSLGRDLSSGMLVSVGNTNHSTTRVIPRKLEIPAVSRKGVESQDCITVDIGKYRNVVLHQDSWRTVVVCNTCKTRSHGRIVNGFPRCIICILDEGYDPVILREKPSLHGPGGITTLSPDFYEQQGYSQSLAMLSKARMGDI